MAYLGGRERRTSVMRRVVKSLESSTPEDVITRYLLNEYDYSLSGARHILEEAKFRAEKPEPKSKRLTS